MVSTDGSKPMASPRVLIVDRDPVIANLVSRYVGHYIENAEVLEAHSAEAARRLVDAGSTWAFVVDTDLPDHEGSGLVCELLQRCPRAVAVLTGSMQCPRPEHPNLLLSLSKPYDVDILTTVLAGALKRLDTAVPSHLSQDGNRYR
jgi:DNA-binding NtrC family response regulator